MSDSERHDMSIFIKHFQTIQVYHVARIILLSFFYLFTLTHICPVDCSTLIYGTSPFQVLEVSAMLFFISFDFEFPLANSVAFDFEFPLANSVDPDQTPDLCLDCLQRSEKWDARYIWVITRKWKSHMYRTIRKIWTAEKIATIILKFEQFRFTIEQCFQ